MPVIVGLFMSAVVKGRMPEGGFIPVVVLEK
jgi:hypothetical protein